MTKNNKVNDTQASRYIGKKQRQLLFQEANYQCEYVSPSTSRRCECKTGLHVDHLYPYAWGGSHDIVNTRILCESPIIFFMPNKRLEEKKWPNFEDSNK